MSTNLRLGAFSISLNVQNIEASKAFYEKLGFREMGGNIEQKWLILKNENAIIGLFQGMFAQNILTFNPGWNELGQEVDPFDDVRAIQQQLQQSGITIQTTADPNMIGPAHITLSDPDGNQILIDQHR
ncbi:MAG TPA: glyoxalase [Chitinophagaceae bacterium]|nr:glyoxalase [Chitinophagaceae bacterium]